MSVINVSETPTESNVEDDNVESTTEQSPDGAEEEVSESTSEESDEELILGKFKSVDDLTKSYSELEKNYGELKRTKSPEAPEEYEMDFSEHEVLSQHSDLVQQVMSESPLISKALEKFKEHNITQEAAQDILSTVLAEDISGMNSSDDIIADLGDDAEKIISETNTFVSRFPVEEQQILSQLGMSAEGVKLVHKLSKLGKEKPLPTNANATTAKSADDYFNEAMSLKKEAGEGFQYNTDVIRQYEALMKKGLEAEERQNK